MGDDGTIKTSMNGACLDVFNFAGPTVDIWSCNGGENQKWLYDKTTRLLKSRQTDYNQCLTARPAGVAWTADGYDGDKYVALFNTESTEPADITVSFASIGLSDNTHCTAYDMWDGGMGASMMGNVHANVPGHGAVLFNVSHCTEF